MNVCENRFHSLSYIQIASIIIIIINNLFFVGITQYYKILKLILGQKTNKNQLQQNGTFKGYLFSNFLSTITTG